MGKTARFHGQRPEPNNKVEADSRDPHQLVATRKEAEDKGKQPVDQKQQACPPRLEVRLRDNVASRPNADAVVSSRWSSDDSTLDNGPNRTDKRPPVLILVEDNEDDFLLLKRALWKSGATAHVWWAHDASQALSMLAELESSQLRICIVADLRLPAASGLALLDMVKAEPCHRHVKFAVLTGCPDSSAEGRALAKGADAFFVKPAQPENLTEVARALQRLALVAGVTAPRARPDT